MRTNFLFTTFLLFVQFSWAQTFYDQNTIQKIEINFTQSNWDYMMDTAKAGKEGYLMAQWVKINGIQYDSAGVKYKGNSSYNASNNKNPLHIALDEFKNQSHEGYQDIKLGNNYADPSMIREVLGYDLLKNYMDCPKANFAKVYINGAYYGVFSNAESINKQFYDVHFGSKSHTAFKCNPIVNPGPATKSNLKYISNDSSNYANFYEVKSTYGWNELVRLCDTITNFPASLENNIDMDRAIWMLAFNMTMDNLDSYSGAFCQNYYLYKDAGRFNPIIWDLNMCFGGLPFVGSGTVSLGSLSIAQLQQLSLSTHSTDVHWPLINQVMANPMYKRMYAAHAKTIVNEMIASNYYQSKASNFQALIDTSVQSDPYKFYTYANFQNAMTSNVSVGSYSVPGITTLMSFRNSYLQAQPEFTLVAPTITSVVYSPPSPVVGDTVWVTANIGGQSYSYLGYRANVFAKFKKLQLMDDGLHHDGLAGDGIYGQKIVATSTVMQYYIYSENGNAGIFSPARAEHEFHSIAVASSVKELDKNTPVFNAYPVPADQTLNLVCSENINSVAIYSIDGKKVLELGKQNSNSVSISTGELASGLYFARANNKASVKFVVKH